MSNYIDPIELELEVTRYQATGTATNRLGVLLLVLARHVAQSWKFAREGHWDQSRRDEFVQDAATLLLRKSLLYNQDKGKLFNYLTTIAINCMRCTWRTEVNHVRILDGYARQKSHENYKPRRRDDKPRDDS